jgi:hypothetical protein
VVAIATLSMRTASIGVTNGPRPPDRSVTRGLSGFNDFGTCNAINKYWQSRLQMARSMFTHAEILMGKNDHRGQTCPYRIFRWLKTGSIF